MNYYEILQISRDAPVDEIKRSFRRLARKYHPDVQPNNPTAQEKFQQIYQAYEVLVDPALRRAYDQSINGGHSSPKTKPLSAQDYYARGKEKALRQDYQGATLDYTQAIKLQPRFVEAYVQRSEARYYLGDHRGVLEDCQQALHIDPQFASAYYYLGRVRYRLGYSQSALDAYSQAISFAPDYALAYYYRGLAHHDLKEYHPAITDWQQAAQLFEQQGDTNSYRLVQDTLNKLGGKKWRFARLLFSYTPNLVKDTLQAGGKLLLNPGGEALGVFATLGKSQALKVGIMLGAIADVSFAMGMNYGWQINGTFTFLKLLTVGMVAWFSLVIMSMLMRSFTRRQGSFSGDVFLASAALLPIGLLTLVSNWVINFSLVIGLVITVFASCDTVLLLYSCCTQITNLSQSVASLSVPVMILTSSCLSYVVFNIMLT